MSMTKHSDCESLPLQGKTILVTRARDQAGVFSSMLIDRGATVIEFPTIEVVPPPSWAELDESLLAIRKFHWIIFTSTNAVNFFMNRIGSLGHDQSLLKGIRICAVGAKTAESLQFRGIKADLIPAEFKAEGVVEAFRTLNIKEKNILIPRAKEAREIIPEKLKELGAVVTVVTVYENVKPTADVARIISLFEQKKIEVITFTSSSTVRNFVEIVGQKGYKSVVKDVIVACIGPVTAKTAEERGMKADIMPKEYTIPALVEAMETYFKNL
jgi:uroporphyrinogen III methyltransferase/synthase